MNAITAYNVAKSLTEKEYRELMVMFGKDLETKTPKQKETQNKKALLKEKLISKYLSK